MKEIDRYDRTCAILKAPCIREQCVFWAELSVTATATEEGAPRPLAESSATETGCALFLGAVAQWGQMVSRTAQSGLDF